MRGLYKRGSVWHIDHTHEGKRYRKSLRISDKKTAETLYHKLITELAEGKYLDKDEGRKRTFAELARKYEDTEFKELKSWESAQSYLNGLKEFFGPYTLSEITPALIDEFKQKRKAKDIKPATIVRQLNILKRMLNLAKKRWMWLKEVPSIEMEPKADRKRLRYLSYEEYSTLLGHCQGWLQDIVIVAAWTGLRQGNILNLKRSQVNLSTRQITIDGSETKNEEPLIIPIAEPVFNVLKENLRVAHIRSPYVFSKPDGKPYYKMEVHRAFRKALEAAGIEDFRFHDLRHCFASWNRQAGMDIDTLADLMGHKDTRMTRRYAHIGPVHLSEAIKRLEENYRLYVTNTSQTATKGLQHTP